MGQDEITDSSECIRVGNWDEIKTQEKMRNAEATGIV
jgi:hypothetical protein